MAMAQAPALMAAFMVQAAGVVAKRPIAGLLADRVVKG